ncbi:MAG: selenoneine synthase SenA [Usitatibacter sp.]
MRGLYDGDRLAVALRDARSRTLALYSHLDLANLAVPCLPIVNPPLWELSHVAWFQEFWCGRQPRQAGGALRPSILRAADGLFNSGTVPHDSRWRLAYPPARELFAYMDATLDATLNALASTPEDGRYFFELALLHEDMHGEALLMTLQTLGLPAPPVGRDPPPSPPSPDADVEFAGGDFIQGTGRDCGQFIFDNEKWAHPVRLAPFAIAKRPVSQGEFAAFVDDVGGEAPRHWRREGSQWLVRRFDRWAPMDPEAPMVHVSLSQALAYCRWAGRRLPTESEWEFAARNGGTDRYPWGDEPREGGGALDLVHRGASLALDDPLPSRSGLKQMLGGVWEWTSSAFVPYPGFSADPYREYSEPWFHTHCVLRGGSFATRSRLVHNRFRNFYLPDRGDVFAGFRTCAVE